MRLCKVEFEGAGACFSSTGCFSVTGLCGGQSPLSPTGRTVNSDVYSISCFMFHLRSVQLIIGGSKFYDYLWFLLHVQCNMARVFFIITREGRILVILQKIRAVLQESGSESACKPSLMTRKSLNRGQAPDCPMSNVTSQVQRTTSIIVHVPFQVHGFDHTADTVPR